MLDIVCYLYIMCGFYILEAELFTRSKVRGSLPEIMTCVCNRRYNRDSRSRSERRLIARGAHARFEILTLHACKHCVPEIVENLAHRSCNPVDDLVVQAMNVLQLRGDNGNDPGFELSKRAEINELAICSYDAHWRNY